MKTYEFKAKTGDAPIIAKDDAAKLISESDDGPQEQNELPWSSEEELIVTKPQWDNNDTQKKRWRHVGSLCLVFPAIFCMAVTLVRLMSKDMLGKDKKLHKRIISSTIARRSWRSCRKGRNSLSNQDVRPTL